jgi:hypothetical protein
MLCTPWLRNSLTTLGLSYLGLNGLGDNFRLGTLKYDFTASMYYGGLNIFAVIFCH